MEKWTSALPNTWASHPSLLKRLYRCLFCFLMSLLPCVFEWNWFAFYFLSQRNQLKWRMWSPRQTFVKPPPGKLRPSAECSRPLSAPAMAFFVCPAWQWWCGPTQVQSNFHIRVRRRRTKKRTDCGYLEWWCQVLLLASGTFQKLNC